MTCEVVSLGRNALDNTLIGIGGAPAAQTVKIDHRIGRETRRLQQPLRALHKPHGDDGRAAVARIDGANAFEGARKVGAVDGDGGVEQVRHAAVGIEPLAPAAIDGRSEEHTSELPPTMRISYAVFCLIKTKK